MLWLESLKYVESSGVTFESTWLNFPCTVLNENVKNEKKQPQIKSITAILGI